MPLRALRDRSPLTIQTRVRLLVIACIMPSWLLAATVAYLSYQRERAVLELSTLEATRGLMQVIEKDLEADLVALRTLATSVRIDNRDFAGFHGQATQVLGYTSGSAIALTDPEGQQIVNTLLPFGAALPRKVNPEVLDRVLRGRQPIVSNLFVGPVRGEWAIAIAVPVLRNDQAVYVLGAGVALSQYDKLLRRPSLPEEAAASLYDGAGTLIARSRASDKFVGRKMSAALAERIRKERQGAFTAPNLDGVPVVAAFSRSEGFGWAVVAGVPEAVLVADLRRSLGLYSAGAVALLLAGLGVASRIGRRIAQPIQALVAPAMALGRGEPMALPTLRLREAEAVGYALLDAQTLLRQRERERDVAELATRQMQIAKQAAERANAVKAAFLSNMSHELRTPLNAIIGFADILQAGYVPANSTKHREFLGHIATSGRHLLQLINDVLDLSKVESGKFEFFPEPVDLPRLIDEALGLLRTEALRKNQVIDAEIEAGLDKLVLDPARLKQVLYNYLSNAIKYTPEGGRVTVRARSEGPEHFRLEVEDTGIGIAPADLDKLFVQFQQLHSGYAKQQQGTGLGLALTRRLAELQGGTAGVRSRLGEGSVFHVVLPKVIGGAARATQPSAPNRHDTPAARVLVIEDDPADQARIAQALTSAGFQVELASTGAEALRLSQEQPYAAITLDLVLPDRTGLEVLATIRHDGLNRAAPVVVITMVSERSAVAGFHVADVLAKPIRNDEVVEALRRAGVSALQRPRVLVIDDEVGALELMSATLVAIGVEAICRRDGRQALRELDALRPHAIVLDLMMPGFDGFAVLGGLRDMPAWKDTPVFVWTSMDLSEAEYAMLSRSARAVLNKGHGGLEALLDELRQWRPNPAEAAEGTP